jgi:hypothetical protein
LAVASNTGHEFLNTLNGLCVRPAPGWPSRTSTSASPACVGTYLRTAAGASFLPRAGGDLRLMLSVFLLEKAVYELGYELDSRPSWVHLPLRGIAQLLGAARAEGR